MVHGANMVVLVAVSSCAAAATWVWKLNHACFPSTSRERRRRRACRLGRTAIYDRMIGVAYGTSMTRPASLSLALSLSVSVSRENKRARLLERWKFSTVEIHTYSSRLCGSFGSFGSFGCLGWFRAGSTGLGLAYGPIERNLWRRKDVCVTSLGERARERESERVRESLGCHGVCLEAWG
jgi:hypothetical protein